MTVSPEKLPESWASVSLGDLFQVVGGGTPSTTEPSYWNGSIPWVTSANIGSAGRISFERWITDDAVAKSATHVVPEGSVIVVTRVGLGKVALAPEEMCFSQDCHALIFQRQHLEPKFVAHQVRWLAQSLRFEGQGTTISGLTKQKLIQTRFSLPPRDEQSRVVIAIEEQFSRLDAAVNALKRVQANLKRYRTAVLKAACEGTLVPTEAELALEEGRDYESASDLLERILQKRRENPTGGRPRITTGISGPDLSQLPSLPKGWIWCRAEQVCDHITKGTTPAKDKLHSKSGEVPFIKVYNLTHIGVLDFTISPTFISRETHSRELARSCVHPGDVLMNIVGPPLGKVALVPDTHADWNVNQAIAIFRPLGGLDKNYLRTLLLNEWTLRWAISRSKATAGQFNLTLETCRDLPIALPPLSEQLRIVAEVERRLSVVMKLETGIDAHLTRAERLRRSILKRAFEGKLVPQDPNDEPASVLLERIRAERAAGGTQSKVRPRRRPTEPVGAPGSPDLFATE